MRQSPVIDNIENLIVGAGAQSKDRARSYRQASHRFTVSALALEQYCPRGVVFQACKRVNKGFLLREQNAEAAKAAVAAIISGGLSERRQHLLMADRLARSKTPT